jgi:hypothetical protein
VVKCVSDLLDPRQGQSKDSLLQSSTENLFGLHNIKKLLKNYKCGGGTSNIGGGGGALNV